MPLKAENQMQHKRGHISAVLYRIPLPVIAVLELRPSDYYPICPRCDRTMDREYMNYCDRCGQCLGWGMFDFAKVIHVPRKRE